MCELLSTSVRTAKKEHTCSLCGQPIEVGTTYDKSFVKSDGPQKTKTHIHCTALATKLRLWYFSDEDITQNDFLTELRDTYKAETGKKGSVNVWIEYMCKKHDVSKEVRI